MAGGKGPKIRHATVERAGIAGRLALPTHGRTMAMLAERDRQAEPAAGQEGPR